MSDVMLFGVLRMPYEMAMGNELSRYQFYQRAQEAANRLEKAEQPAPIAVPAAVSDGELPPLPPSLTWSNRLDGTRCPTYIARQMHTYARAAIQADRESRAALKAQPAPTEAQGSFLVRVTPTDPEYSDVHPQLALEDALRVNPHGWPDGFQFEIVGIQGEDSARLDAACDCDNPDWCKNYNRCHRQVCGFPLRGTLPKPV